jgi:hypothetical protein
MTSNISVTPGSGATIAADDIGGGLLAQRVKLAVGTTGSGTDLAFGQQAKAASLPVVLASDQGALPVTVPVGQAAMAASTPVVIASNQSAVPVTVPLGQQNKAGSLSVALASDQGALAVTVPLGQQAKAASTPVVIASDQGALAVTVPVGQQVMASSTPVVIASNQSAVPVTVPVGQQTKAASTPVVIASDQGALSVSVASTSFDVALSTTRPANTTAYAAGAVVGAATAAMTFASVGPSGSAIMVTGTQFEIDVSAIPSGMTSFRLYLYNVTPPSAFADGAAWDLPSGDRASFLGYVDLGTPVDLGSTLYVEASNINKQLRLSSANVFGYLVTNGGYTPGSGDVFKITLHTVAV